MRNLAARDRRRIKNGTRQTMIPQRALKRPILRLVLSALLALPLLPSEAGRARAQDNPFAPVITVNSQVITRYELDQRLRFLTVLQQAGDLAQLARDGLIEDRLRMDLARKLSLEVTPEALQRGMEEFASRANLTAEKFMEIIAQDGVESEGFRDFVEAGLVWREIVRAKYGPTVRISEAEIDRALADFVPTTQPAVRIAEIVLPASGAQRGTVMVQARRLKSQLAQGAEFAALARIHSQSPTAARNGDMGVKLLAEMPDASAAVLRNLAPGQISDPVILEDSVVIYQMQEVSDAPLASDSELMIDYAQFLYPAAEPGEGERVRRAVDNCGGLYKVAEGLPPERLTRESRPQSQVPGDIAAALALLDPGESTTVLRRGDWQVFLMLCDRHYGEDLQPTREQVRTQLTNQRLAALADVYLEELRSEAMIRER